MPSVSIVLLTCGILVVLMLLLWMLQWKWVNAAWADVVWAFCTAGGGIALALQCDSPPGRRVLVAVLAGCWGLRLGLYMTTRLRRHGSDSRYESMEQRYADRLQLFYFGFFVLQGLGAAAFTLPVMAAAAGPWPSAWAICGAVVVALGMVLVTVSDRQLATFKRTNTDPTALCRRGLWSWSRHPNYFFEWMTWCGWAVMAAAGTGWWLALGGAGLMLLFLLKVSGIPHVERESIRRRGEAYLAYQRTTSMFIPLPPRRGGEDER